VLLEYLFESAADATAQRGYGPPPRTDHDVVYYRGDHFPFADGEFDYVICSHVFEHVPDPKGFAAELMRVAPRGYVEVPSPLYEFLFDLEPHLHYTTFADGCLRYLPKSRTSIHEFFPAHSILRDALTAGRDGVVNELFPLMGSGAEWQGGFSVEECETFAQICEPLTNVRARPRSRAARWIHRVDNWLSRRTF
jgi:hypothetical protein